MSHYTGNNPKPSSELGFDSLSDRLYGALIMENNKPDFKELDLGSPVSPLRTHFSGASAGASTAITTTTTTSSSSSSSGSVTGKSGSTSVVRRSDGGGGGGSHSGELSGSVESSPAGRSKKGHVRSNSTGAPLIYSGGGSVNSPNSSPAVLPSGNICPSGKIGGMTSRTPARNDVLGSGTGNYGHGSIMRGCGGSKPGGAGGSSAEAATGNILFAGDSGMVKRAMMSSDPEEVKRVGNEQYKRGNFVEALSLYDRAIALLPDNVAYRSNRAAALMGLGRLVEAVRECEEALRLDSAYARAHHRLLSLHIRLGQVENARRHLYVAGQQPDSSELQKFQAVERHLIRCADSRKIKDWKSVLREGDAAIASGVDSSPQLFASRGEALVKLHQLMEADSALSNMPRFESSSSSSETKFFGMLSDAYAYFVRAQVEMALGRFENAVTAAEKAAQIDPRNVEVAALLNNVRSVVRARSHGNDLFNSGKFAEACSSYGEGLQFDPSNPVLYCNRAACRFKLGQWERSVEDCNHALRIQPNYTKALLRRAASNGKLERWAESVRDYETLRKELPDDNEVAEALFHAQVALKKSRGEEVYNMKFGGEVEEISGVDQFRAVISSPGVSVVHFKVASNQQCEQISPFFNVLCHRYPSVNFLKVDVENCPAVTKAENVKIVPTFKIYKNGTRVKEMICPSKQVLEYSLRHYSL